VSEKLTFSHSTAPDARALAESELELVYRVLTTALGDGRA
jgi:hypothetical protein